MAVITRFQSTSRGAIIITGNVLGLAGDVNGEGILNFTVSNPPSPPGGSTTTTWQNNSSSAFLNLPANSKVLYAELTWSAQLNSSISGNLNNPIILETPIGTNSILPDSATSQIISVSGLGDFYVRTQNVTTIIDDGGSGMYTVRGVPGIIAGFNNYVGWCLVVAFYNMALPIRNMSIWTMLQQVSGGGGNVDVPITNFATPPLGPVTGRIVVAAGGGNSHISGDFMKFGVTTTSLVTLSGPNNPSNNFFCSQINNGDPLSSNVGKIDTTGSFGTWNSTPPQKAIVGDRNSFDITNVSALGLTNNQTTGIIRLGTNGDTYEAIALGFQIDVNAPFLTPIVKSAPVSVELGDTFTYTVYFANKGVADALNTVFIDTIPNETVFIPNSVSINNVLQPGANPAAPNGISLGNILLNQEITISFKVRVTTIPANSLLSNQSEVGYSYSPGVGLQAISTNESSNIAKTIVNGATILTSQKFVDKSFVDCGETLTYTIRINNVGNFTALNVIFKDTIPNGTQFVTDSVFINGSQQIGATPAVGVSIPDIVPHSVTSLTFSVVVIC